MGILHQATREQLLDLLEKLALLDTRAGRDLLVRDLPPTVVNGIERSEAKVVDLDHIVYAADSWWPLDGPVADYPLHLLVAAAVVLAEGTQYAPALQAFLATLPATLDPADRPRCPYPGMVPFRPEDARFFYGREAEIAEMLRRLRVGRYLLVIGPSGSGKSSLVTAGLLPTLTTRQPGTWHAITLRPGAAPVAALAQTLGSTAAQPAPAVAALLAGHTPATRLLVIVDQFEELFTQADRAAQAAFFTALPALRQIEAVTLLLLMRADFYSDLMASSLWPLGESQRLEIAPLRGDALRAAITRPAADVGVEVEPGLVERLVADAADEPGSLPLLQEALVLLWEQLRGRTLRLADYEALGAGDRSGLAVALATRADATYDNLIPAQQAVARRLFLRLVAFGEGRTDTRRQQPLAALQVPNEDAALFQATLAALTDHRLLTTSGEGQAAGGRRVDIAHEALIRGWPLLHGWIAARRMAEQTRRRLEDKATEWGRLGRGAGGLLDAAELPEAERWLASEDAGELGASADLVALVAASQQALVEAEQAREAARQRELAQAQALAAEQQRVAEAERERAEAALRQIRTVQARQLTVQSNAVLAQYPQRSLLLAAQALTLTLREGEAPAADAEEALRQALGVLGGVGLPGHAVALSADGHWLVTGSADATRLWDLTAPDPAASPLVLPGHEGSIQAEAISADGHWLVTASADTTARLWDLTAPDPAASSRVLHGYESSIGAGTLSADGHWLVTGSTDGTARLWDLTAPDPAASPRVLRDPDSTIYTVALSADGHWLVTGSADGTARLWDLTAPDPATSPRVLRDPVVRPWRRGGPSIIKVVAFSADGHWLVTAGDTPGAFGSDDAIALLWDLGVEDPAASPLVLSGHEQDIVTVAISADGHWLVTGSDDHTTRLWDLTAPDPTASPQGLRGHEGSIQAVAFSANGHWLVTASDDHTARLWDLTAPDPEVNPQVLGGQAVAISADGHWLVTASADTTARLWDLTTADPAASPQVLHGYESSIGAGALSADGHWLVTNGDENTARLWNLTATDLAASPRVLPGQAGAIALSMDEHWLVTDSDGTARLWDLRAPDPAASPRVLCTHKGSINQVALSADGHWLVTSSGDAMAWLWDLTTPDPAASSRVLPGHERGITAMAFSADGHWLVIGSRDNTARLWDLTAPNPAASPRVLHVVLRVGADFITAVALNADGHWLVTRSHDITAQLWDLRVEGPAASPRMLHSPEGVITAVAFSADGHWLVTVSNNSKAMLWDLTAPDQAASPQVLPGHAAAIALSADGHWLVTAGDTPWAVGGDDTTARLWDLTAPDPAASPRVLRGLRDAIRAVALSADGHWLVTGSQTARLWDLTALEPAVNPRVLPGHSEAIETMAFSADGHWLVIGSHDNTARLWNLRLPELVDLACRTAGRNLTRAEWEQYLGASTPYAATCPSLPVEPLPG